jgi:hypothetical protein
MEDIHVFGEKDYLDADAYREGDTIQVEVLEYIGRHTYKAKDNTDRWAAYYIVRTAEGKKKQFRLAITNEVYLKRNAGLTDYSQLIGKTLTLQVQHFGLGHNGFMITAVGNAAPSTPSTEAPPSTSEELITPKQASYIRSFMDKDADAQSYALYYLHQLVKQNVEQLTRAEASKLIDALKSNSFKFNPDFLAWRNATENDGKNEDGKVP